MSNARLRVVPDRKALETELGLFGTDFPKLRPHELFVAWFLFAYVSGDRDSAVNALTGWSDEKGIDALYIDRKAKLVSVVQGKYAETITRKNEPKTAVDGFAAVAQHLAGDDVEFQDFCTGLERHATQRVKEARRCLLAEDFRLTMHFATLNRITKTVRKDADHLVRRVSIPGPMRPQLICSDGSQVMAILADYLDGVAPPVPRAELEVDGSPHEDHDKKTGVSSWSFAVNGLEIAKLFSHGGRKLFARNIRGFLGEDTPVNREMRATLRSHPERFWYLNNGITIVCDGASSETESGATNLALKNPQIINGQQTTYALAANPRGAARAKVSVRAIVLPRGRDDRNWATYEAMVASVVRATNSQNQIKPSDLRSNDRVQVRLERELHKRDYQYHRKRAASAEQGGAQYQWALSKYEVAKSVMTCESSATVLSEGREVLFEDQYYERIFKRPIDKLLVHLWLCRLVGSLARGRADWQWAKFVVIEFMWDDLWPSIQPHQRAFVAMSESWRDEPAKDELRRAAKRVLQAGTKHFNERGGKGAERLELSTFFKQRGRREEFDRFWRSQRNPHRPHYTKAARSFEKLLDSRTS